MPELWRRFQQKKLTRAFGPEFVDALPNLPWTFDNSYIAPQDGMAPINRFFRSLGMKMRSRLDYFVTRNMKLKSGRVMDLPGSDHRPVMAEFYFEKDI